MIALLKDFACAGDWPAVAECLAGYKPDLSAADPVERRKVVELVAASREVVAADGDPLAAGTALGGLEAAATTLYRRKPSAKALREDGVADAQIAKMHGVTLDRLYQMTEEQLSRPASVPIPPTPVGDAEWAAFVASHTPAEAEAPARRACATPVADLIAQGVTARQVAKMHGLDPSDVMAYASSLGTFAADDPLLTRSVAARLEDERLFAGNRGSRLDGAWDDDTAARTLHEEGLSPWQCWVAMTRAGRPVTLAAVADLLSVPAVRDDAAQPGPEATTKAASP